MSSPSFIDVPFGPYIYDLQGTPNSEAPGYLVSVKGLRPSPLGYRPISLFEDSGAAVPGTLAGRLYAANVTGTVKVFACSASFGPTNTRFHQSDDLGATWNDVEGASGAPGLWPDFCQFDTLVIAASLARVPQSKILTVQASTAFGDLAGSPPTAATVAQVRDHVVLGNLSTDFYAVQWSAIGDPEDWPTPGTADARSKQAGTQNLPRALGRITKVVGGEKFGLIFQERGITRMTYVGGAAVYEFDTFERNIGTGPTQNDTADSKLIPHPVADIGKFFIWGTDQSIFVTDGYSVRRVSSGRFDLLYFGTHSSIAFDRYSNLAVLPTSAENAFLYNPATDQFGVSTQFTASVCDYPVSSGTVNGLNILNFNYSTMKLQRQTSALEEDIELITGYIEIDPGYRIQFQGVELLGRLIPGSVAVSARMVDSFEDADSTSGTPSYTSLTEQTRSKQFAGRLNGRFIAFKITGTVTSPQQLFRGLRIHYRRDSQI